MKTDLSPRQNPACLERQAGGETGRPPIHPMQTLPPDPGRGTTRPVAPVLLLATALLGSSLLPGCATPAQTAGAVIGGVTVAGAQIPTDEIEQIYYLGVFDPQEQLPPTIYRVTVRGQSSFLNSSKFASGWVHAGLIDSLSSRASDTGIGATDFPGTGQAPNADDLLKVGRRLVMFGPEGFREAPKDHRLVVVMGGDPKAFFDAVDLALGDMGGVKVQQAQLSTVSDMSKAFSQAQTVDNQLETLLEDARKTLSPSPK